MGVVPEAQRITTLKRLGACEPLVMLASGECVHPTFRNSCLGPPYFSYHMAEPPTGSTFVPLWDHCDTVVGVWQRTDGPEYIKYHIERNDQNEYEPLARTEQGFWVTRFDFLFESDVPFEELQEAAAAVSFRFLDRYLASRESSETQLGTFEGHTAWLTELVATIDRECRDAEP